MKNKIDKILIITFILCIILIKVLFIYLFDFFTSLTITLLITAPYLFIGILYILPKTKKTNIVVNKRIEQTAMLVFIAQIIVFYLFRIHNGIIVFLILIVLFTYLIFFLRSIDSLVKNWKVYRLKSKIFNCILIIYSIPLLYIVLFLRLEHQITNNLSDDENSESIKKEDIRLINEKSGKEMNLDSIMKPHVDSIIKKHKYNR